MDKKNLKHRIIIECDNIYNANATQLQLSMAGICSKMETYNPDAVAT